MDLSQLSSSQQLLSPPLPQNALLNIFSYLPEANLRQVALCSKKFLSLSRHEYIYQMHCLKEFPTTCQ
ncbi:MAG: F-box protein [Verrucomicrobia bacterium]|nr:F-box protein [Verrucomicrobiota bacterium]